ncbi:hypothetical protein CPB86DRAFT_820526 [Serendipita vermifera]|nr:hypothetical protein CPB86DRAFT_820526 [Serendipita vermifera]
MPPKRNPSQANLDPSPTPSTSNKRRDKSTTHEQVSANLIAGTQVVESMSGATNLLSPLKGTCQLIRIILETTRAMKDNTEGWNELDKTLESHLQCLQPYIDRVQGSGNLSNANQELIIPLKTYAENLQSIQETIGNAIDIRQSRPKKLFCKVSDVRIEAKEIEKHNQELVRQFQQFSSSIDAYIATQIQTITETMHTIVPSGKDNFSLRSLLTEYPSDGKRFT